MPTMRIRQTLLSLASILIGTTGCKSDEITHFGKSTVKHVSNNNSYMLTPMPDDFSIGKTVPTLVLQCFPRDPNLTLMMALLDTSRPIFGPQLVTIWSDKSAPHDIQIVGVLSGLMGIATTKRDDVSRNAVRMALEAVISADRFISYSHSTETGVIKSQHLGAARTRFQQVCAQDALR